jgi:hypothetical protein
MKGKTERSRLKKYGDALIGDLKESFVCFLPLRYDTPVGSRCLRPLGS